MHELRTLPRLPRLGLWTDGEGGCSVFISYAAPGARLRIDQEELAARLAHRGLRLRGICRSTRDVRPPAGGLGAEAQWMGGDPVEEIVALAPSRA